MRPYKGADIVPLPGTKRQRYLEEDVGAADVLLSAEEMAELDAPLNSLARSNGIQSR